MENQIEKTIGFVGGGNMAEAIFSGLIGAKAASASNIAVADISSQRLGELSNRYGIHTALNDPGDNFAVAEMARQCDVVFLAVKPQFSRPVLKSLEPVLSDNQLLISIVGGLTIEQIEEFVKTPVIRAMPNTPMAMLEGVAGISAGTKCNDNHVAFVMEIFGHLGKVFALPERLIDPLTGISGCGPAYAYIFIEALADGAVNCGLPRELAYQLAAQTLLGSAKMVLESGKHPANLKDDVCSPGGATIAGVQTLEQGKFRASVINAVKSGVDRMAEAGKKA